MIDPPLAFAAPSGAQSAFATQPAKNSGEDAGFAAALAQSTRQAGPVAAMAERADASIPPKPVAEDDIDAHQADEAARVSLDAMIALAAAESPHALLPTAATPVEIPSVEAEAGSTGEELNRAVTIQPGANPAANVASGNAPRASAAEDTTGTPLDLLPAIAELPAPRAAMINAQAANTDGTARRAPAHEDGGRESPSTHPPALAELRDTGVPRKGGESSPAPQQLETTPVNNLATSAMAHAQSARGDVAQAAITLVPTHVESPAWSRDFGLHVIRLAVEGQPAAEIHLNPPDWGPITVSIGIDGQDATLRFVAEHSQTREALEAALPRLREIFASGNLTLASAEVTSQFSPRQFSGSHGQSSGQPQAAASMRSLVIEDAPPSAIATPRVVAGRSRIDLFA